MQPDAAAVLAATRGLRGRRGRHPARAARRRAPAGPATRSPRAAGPGPLVGVPGAAARGAGRAATTRRRARWRARLTGRAISLQTFHIGPKIAEWDAVALPDRVVEVHPELALRAMAPEVDFAPKKSARGAGQRIAALARWVDPAVALGDLPAGARLDDVLDALAVAWSAARWARGAAEVLGASGRARRPRPPHARVVC